MANPFFRSSQGLFEHGSKNGSISEITTELNPDEYIKKIGHRAFVKYVPEKNMFRGEFLGVNERAYFYTASIEELKKEKNLLEHLS